MVFAHHFLRIDISDKDRDWSVIVREHFILNFIFHSENESSLVAYKNSLRLAFLHNQCTVAASVARAHTHTKGNGQPL